MTRPNSARLVLSPLLLLVALLTTLGVNASSAAANAGPETRVRAIPTVVEISVRQQSSETAGGVGCLRPTQPGLAPGSCVATESVDLYRGMKPGGAGLPEVGPSAKTLGVRPGTDIPVDAHGMVHPGTGGMSVNTSPTGMPEFRRPPSFGGSAKDVDMFCIQSCDLGPSLRFRADPGSAGHGFVEPVRPMTIGEYQQALAGTQGQWGGVEP
jgi:hypothetical protein